ncbi:MAG TPA: DUF5777 family beta-barrel protein, partial [Nitrosopumilaceae archaeon]|nr:DUF5777 family beta-barrel protein [Nitrosopumilaceae archaeon]
QVMIARKFNGWLSAQLTASMVHYNLVDNMTDGNDCYVIGGLARFKYNKRQSICVEYGYRVNKYSATKYYNSSAIGWEIETGGHVFQMFFTNSMGMTENKFLMYTDTDWNTNMSTWGVRLGFNISRSFSLNRKSSDGNSW